MSVCVCVCVCGIPRFVRVRTLTEGLDIVRLIGERRHLEWICNGKVRVQPPAGLLFCAVLAPNAVTRHLLISMTVTSTQ